MKKSAALLLFFLLGRSHAQAPLSFRDGFSAVAQKTIDGVVNISTTWRARKSGDSDRSLDPFGSLFEGLFKNNPAPRKRVSLGSGFLVRARTEKGQEKIVVVTNCHVVRNVHRHKGRIHVSLNSGKKVTATVIGWDEQLDLAALDLDTKEPLKALEWGRSSEIRVGNWALAIGNPFGLGGTFTTGVVSHTQRVLKEGTLGNATYVDRWIQTDTPVNQGSSGGALLNIDGQVIGINTAIFTPTGGSVGVALAIPESIARPAVEQLVRCGSIQRAFIGVQPGLSVDEKMAQSLGMPKDICGVYVDDVTRDQSADKAGLRRGDIILRIDGHPIKDAGRMRIVIGGFKSGQKLSMDIWRPNHGGKGEKKTIHLIAGCAPCPNEQKLQPSPRKSIFGIRGVEIEQIQKIRGQGLEGLEGPFVIITGVGRKQGSLQESDIILSIDNQAVHTIKDCVDAADRALGSNQEKVMFWIARPVTNLFSGGDPQYIKRHVAVCVQGTKKG